MNYCRIICNDIRKSRLTTMITTLFVALAAMLVSLAVILALNLAGALDRLMVQAETPHFMQMHSGPLDAEPLNRFASHHEAVDRYQILEFLNIDNGEIELNGQSLISSTQDNGISTQSGHHPCRRRYLRSGLLYAGSRHEDRRHRLHLWNSVSRSRISAGFTDELHALFLQTLPR